MSYEDYSDQNYKVFVLLKKKVFDCLFEKLDTKVFRKKEIERESFAITFYLLLRPKCYFKTSDIFCHKYFKALKTRQKLFLQTIFGLVP